MLLIMVGGEGARAGYVCRETSVSSFIQLQRIEVTLFVTFDCVKIPICDELILPQSCFRIFRVDRIVHPAGWNTHIHQPLCGLNSGNKVRVRCTLYVQWRSLTFWPIPATQLIIIIIECIYIRGIAFACSRIFCALLCKRSHRVRHYITAQCTVSDWVVSCPFPEWNNYPLCRNRNVPFVSLLWRKISTHTRK